MLFGNSAFYMIRLSLRQMETQWVLKKQSLMNNQWCVEVEEVTSAAVVL